MLKAAAYRGEFHEFGGNGRLIFAESDCISDELIRDYRGKVKLIYLDPPYCMSGGLEFQDSTARAAYDGIHAEEEHIAMLRKVLICCSDLLSMNGSIYVHVNPHMSGIIRMMMDEIFGKSNLMNEIIWTYKSGGRAIKHFSRKHDTILFYRKSKCVYFNIQAAGIPRGSMNRNHMKQRVDEDGRIYFSIKSGGREYRYYEDDKVFPSDVWTDIEYLHQRDPERTGYAAQKPESLLKRIISVSSEPDDIIMDLFGGSGTTAAVAAKMGRRFVTVDCGNAALLVMRRRFLNLENPDGLFSLQKPFEIDYKAEPAILDAEQAEQLIDIEAIRDGHSIRLCRSEKRGCAYAAVGIIVDGVFHARKYVTKPMRDECLFVPYGYAIHLTDSECRQGIFTIS